MYRFLLLGLLIMLTGCKASLETDLMVSDLLNSPSKSIGSTLYLEIAGCSDFADSRLPSSSLLEAQEIITDIFPSSQYKDCFSRDFTSYAQFTMPIFLNKEEDPMVTDSEGIYFFSNSKTLLNVAMSPQLQRKIQTSVKNTFMAGPVDLNVSLFLRNDTDKDFGPMMIFSSFIEGQPVILSKATIPPGKTQEIRLSDVSAQSIMNGENTTVLAYPFKLAYE